MSTTICLSDQILAFRHSLRYIHVQLGRPSAGEDGDKL